MLICNFLNSIINNFIKVVKIIRNTISRLLFNDIYHKFMSPHFKEMKFIAFDSFEELPVLKGIDALNGYSSH